MSQEKSDKWVMPEPTFRRSTGELVQPSDIFPVDPEPDTLEPASYEEDVLELPDDPLAKLYAPPAGHVEAEVPPTLAQEPEMPAPAVAVEPQPLISEEFTAERIVVTAAKPKPKKGSSPALVAVGALALVGIAIGFVVLIYFLFFASRPDTGGF